MMSRITLALSQETALGKYTRTYRVGAHTQPDGVQLFASALQRHILKYYTVRWLYSQSDVLTANVAEMLFFLLRYAAAAIFVLL